MTTHQERIPAEPEFRGGKEGQPVEELVGDVKPQVPHYTGLGKVVLLRGLIEFELQDWAGKPMLCIVQGTNRVTLSTEQMTMLKNFIAGGLEF